MRLLRSFPLEGGTSQPIQANCTGRANGKMCVHVCVCVCVCVLDVLYLVSLIICFIFP